MVQILCGTVKTYQQCKFYWPTFLIFRRNFDLLHGKLRELQRTIHFLSTYIVDFYKPSNPNISNISYQNVQFVSFIGYKLLTLVGRRNCVALR